MGIKVHVIFYSMYGHVYRMAEAVLAGVKEVAGAEASLFQVAELTPDAVLEKSGAKAARAAFAHVPVATMDSLAEPHAVIFGTPTRFGNMAAPMRNFLDQTGGLWAKGTLIGKIGSVFAATALPHGGQQKTRTGFPTHLRHRGVILVGVPYSESGLTNMVDISGGTPYGATTLAGPDGSRQPSPNELKIARFQGRRVAEIASKLFR